MDFFFLYRALEKVDKQQLNRERFEIFLTISWFGAFLITLPLNITIKPASKSGQLTTFIEIIIKSTFCKVFTKIAYRNSSEPLEPLLDLIQVQLFPVHWIFLIFQILPLMFLVSATVCNALPGLYRGGTCNIMDVFPFFKEHNADQYRQMDNMKKEKLKIRLVFMTELSRFLNKKAPMLLQVNTKSLMLYIKVYEYLSGSTFSKARTGYKVRGPSNVMFWFAPWNLETLSGKLSILFDFENFENQMEIAT